MESSNNLTIKAFNKMTPKTYKFIDLKDLIIDKGESELSFIEYDDEEDDTVSNSISSQNLSSLLHVSSISNRLSVGTLVPGIRVRSDESTRRLLP